jgi:hypothetical protein
MTARWTSVVPVLMDDADDVGMLLEGPDGATDDASLVSVDGEPPRCVNVIALSSTPVVGWLLCDALDEELLFALLPLGLALVGVR